jgi:hypothetical protein
LPASYADSAFKTTHGLESNYCRNPTPDSRNTIFCYTTDPVTSLEECKPMKEWQVFNPTYNILTDNHLVNITNESSLAIAYIDNTMTQANPLNMNLQMSFSNLFVNMKSDFSEETLFLEATTRGDNKIKKEIFLGVKKSC